MMDPYIRLNLRLMHFIIPLQFCTIHDITTCGGGCSFAEFLAFWAQPKYP